MTDVEHCKDCCCARSWKALGITNYTGKSIPEHIEQLRGLLDLAKEEHYCGPDVEKCVSPFCQAMRAAGER